jgi:uncharacterized membrane protein
MEPIYILLLIVLAVLVIAPIVIASNTKSSIDNLLYRIDSIEYKIDELIRNNKKQVVSPVKQAEPPKEIIREYKSIEIIEPEPPVFTPPVFEIPKKEIIPVVKNMFVEKKEMAYEQEEQYAPSFTPPESWWDKFNRNNPDLETFVGENLISKIGIAVLVLGIAFFVKFAIDKDWINEYARVGLGILAGGIVLVFAHRLHKKYKAFSSVLVAGAIAIFYFTITIAYQTYNIFNQPTAFAIMACIMAFSVFISLMYDRQELAVLSLIGGFAAPFMVSHGDGNYKVLFTYILILDLGMLFIAFKRNWKLVYLLSYIFTIVLYGGWYFNKVMDATNPPYFGALIFAAVFYFTFFIAGVINNIRTKQAFSASDLSMLLIFNFLFCGVGLNIFSNYHIELKGAFIVALAAFNFICSRILYKRFNADKSLVYLLIGLTLSYATLAAPIQLHGNHITLFWAAEAVVLMWLAKRSEIKIFRFSSVIVHLLMLVSLVMDWQNIYLGNNTEALAIILNKGFITSLFCISSLLSLIYLLRNEDSEFMYLDFTFNSKIYRNTLITFTLIAAYISGILELNFQLTGHLINAVLINISLACYHLVFSAFIIFTALRRTSEKSKFFAFLLGIINMVLYLFTINDLPFEQLRNGIPVASGFIIHYLSLTAFIYSSFLLLNFVIKTDTYNSRMKRFAWWILAFFAVFIASSELMLHVLSFSSLGNIDMTEGAYQFPPNYFNIQTQVIKTGYPILWGIVAFVFLFIGMRKQQKELRILSLVLLTITLVKLFAYDMNQASEGGKIIAFILLGILLLVMSFMYQKIKAIILDDEK